MRTHRQLAIAAMQAATKMAANDFMHQANIRMPEAIAPGALPAMIRETVLAEDLHRLVDVDMLWTIGDYVPDLDCSAYYDPSSPWYNVIYGAYGLRSYKRDGSAWGFDRDGRPNFPEFFEVSAIDYNFLTAGQFGCPTSEMCFAVEHVDQDTEHGWAFADMVATIPSGLHDFTATLGNPLAYVIYGIPPRHLLKQGHLAYEPVQMRGRLYMRQMTQGPQPITLGWGALCPDTDAGKALLRTIIDVMGQQYRAL